jgi:hypothetical protein
LTGVKVLKKPSFFIRNSFYAYWATPEPSANGSAIWVPPVASDYEPLVTVA